MSRGAVDASPSPRRAHLPRSLRCFTNEARMSLMRSAICLTSVSLVHVDGGRARAVQVLFILFSVRERGRENWMEITTKDKKAPTGAKYAPLGAELGRSEDLLHQPCAVDRGVGVHGPRWWVGGIKHEGFRWLPSALACLSLLHSSPTTAKTCALYTDRMTILICDSTALAVCGLSVTT